MLKCHRQSTLIMCSHPRVQNTAISPEGTASHTGTAEWLSYTGGQTFVPVRWWEVSNLAESAVPFRNFKCCNLFSFHLPISSPFHYRNIRHPLCLSIVFILYNNQRHRHHLDCWPIICIFVLPPASQ